MDSLFGFFPSPLELLILVLLVLGVFAFWGRLYPSSLRSMGRAIRKLGGSSPRVENHLPSEKGER